VGWQGGASTCRERLERARARGGEAHTAHLSANEGVGGEVEATHQLHSLVRWTLVVCWRRAGRGGRGR
jgi:hypothetical protein